MKKLTVQNTFAVTILLVLIPAATGIIAAEAHKPENAATESDLVVHGKVDSVANSGSVARHHPVRIDIIDILKGNKTEIRGENLSESITVQVRGAEKMDVSTAAQFTEGEEVVVMLKERNSLYYMATGYATKYKVENDTIQLSAPERKNITVSEMRTIVENAPVSNRTDTETEPEAEGLLSKIIELFTDLF